MTAIIVLAGFFPSGMLQAETLWTPRMNLNAVKDDNVFFKRTDTVDDYVYNVEPGLRFDVDQEVTKLSADGRVMIRRYQDNDTLDDENYRFNMTGRTKVTERFNLAGRYKFIKDTTLDSELEETGRIFAREDRLSHYGMLAPSYNLTERTSIGVTGRYRNADYDSGDKIDYSRWDVSVPVRWRLATEIDLIYISPGYAYRDSDINRSESYNVRVGWDHESTERLTVNLSAGVRYSEFEKVNTAKTEDNWGVLGNLKFIYDFEIGSFTIDFQQDLTNTADGDQVDMSKVILRLRYNFTERMGMELNGRYYYSQSEGKDNNDSRAYVRAGSELFYHLTQNHLVFISYEYSQENEEEIVDEPHAERNRILAGINLNFPLN